MDIDQEGIDTMDGEFIFEEDPFATEESISIAKRIQEKRNYYQKNTKSYSEICLKADRQRYSPPEAKKSMWVRN